MRPGLEVRHAFQPRNVEEDAACHDAFLEDGDPELRAAAVSADHVLEEEAVVQLPIVRDVAESIEVREDRPVKADFLLLDGDPALAEDVDLMRQRIGDVDRLLHRGVVRKRDRFCRLHERQRLLALGRCDQIRGTQLIVLPPSTRVRELGHPTLELLFAGSTVVHGGALSGAAPSARLLTGRLGSASWRRLHKGPPGQTQTSGHRGGPHRH